MKPTFYMMVGPPGSGKSTWCRKYMWKYSKNPVIINRDALQLMIHGGDYSKYWDHIDNQEEVRDLLKRFETHAILTALNTGFDVFLDRTCMSAAERAKYTTVLSSMAKPVTVMAVDFTVYRNKQLTDDILVARRMNDARGHTKERWASIIKDMWDRFDPPVEIEDYMVPPAEELGL